MDANMNKEMIDCFNRIDQITYLKQKNAVGNDTEIQHQITEIYEDLKEFTGYTEEPWEDQTLQLRKKPLTSKNMEKWLTTATTLIAVKIILATLSERPYLTEEAAHKLLGFVDTMKSAQTIKARALYCIALCMELESPKLCYDYSIKAFNIDPNLASLFELDYVYDKKRIQDSYFHSCPICGAKDATPTYCVQQLGIMKAGSTLSPAKLWMKCDACENLYAYNFPTSQMSTMNGHYTGSANQNTIEPRYQLGELCSALFNQIKSLTKGDRYLEVGIGKGEMLACALEMGYDVDAVEICRADCENVSAVLGVDVQWCDFIDFESDQKYDVIIMGDVLEHVSKPMKALEKAYDLLNPEGVLWLSTPNYNSGFSRLMKLSDPMWNQANHFTYYSYESLLPILENLGLKMRHYDISKRYNGSMELFLQK